METLVSREETFDAVMRNLAIIGEAAGRIPAEFKESHTVIPWRKIVAFRNVAIHEYFGIDDEIVWDIIENEIPDLSAKLQILIKSLPDKQ